MISIVKRKASWLKSHRLTLKQYFISSLSFFTLPFAKFRENAAKLYFTKIYNGYNDPLLFDGKKGQYLEQIKKNIHLEVLTNKHIVDIGCGNGALYNWLVENNIILESYTGLDFAHQNIIFNNYAEIVNIDVVNVDFSIYNNSHYFFLINSMCYLDDEKMEYMLEGINKDSTLILIEPVPGLFWDAHFEGVKIYYRNLDKTIKLLSKFNFLVYSISIDYQIKVINNHFFKLCYCLYAKKKL